MSHKAAEQKKVIDMFVTVAVSFVLLFFE